MEYGSDRILHSNTNCLDYSPTFLESANNNKDRDKNEIVKNQREDIVKQTAEVDDLITMLKNLEPLEKREVRGIMIGMQMAKMAGNKTA